MHIRAEANLKVLYRGINKVCAWNARGNLVIVIIFYLRFISDHIFIHLKSSSLLSTTAAIKNASTKLFSSITRIFFTALFA